MIRILGPQASETGTEGLLRSAGTEGLLRSVYADLTPDTAFSRDVEVRAGQELADRLASMGELPVGAAVITPAGELSSGFLIHVVLQAPDEPVRIEGVKTALRNGLRRAQEWGLETLALPPLGTGAGNLDVEDVAEAMVSLIHDHLTTSECPKEVTIVSATEYEREIFRRTVESVAGPAAAPEG